ncbi:MAG: hypothetical protein JHC95_22070 [Solirubrobacteraceae bacterium]|nr:hypothetical protein [Solirubrobacteraceae bacterium]
MIEDAEALLLAAQDADGAWRDYALEPGRSDAWTTAVVATALVAPPVLPEAVPAIARACAFLHASRRHDGWGYNAQTASDADTTAWTLTLLAAADDLRGVDPVALLAPRIDAGGGAHTFAGGRFGSWSQEHPEVTAVVGSLLFEQGAGPGVIARISATQQPDGAWPAFWWTDDAYVTARSLLTLRQAGTLTREAARLGRDWLARRLARPATAFGEAHLVLAASALDDEALVERATRRLLARREPDGGWPSSRTLLVPAQHGLPHAGVAFADDRRLMTTAVAVSALKEARRVGSARRWCSETDLTASAW